jgi:hypothetical protein
MRDEVRAKVGFISSIEAIILHFCIQQYFWKSTQQ